MMLGRLRTNVEDEDCVIKLDSNNNVNIVLAAVVVVLVVDDILIRAVVDVVGNRFLFCCFCRRLLLQWMHDDGDNAFIVCRPCLLLKYIKYISVAVCITS